MKTILTIIALTVFSISSTTIYPSWSLTFDDNLSSWVYSSGWLFYNPSGNGAYDGTLHYTNVQNATATITNAFNHFTFTYTKYINRGSFQVYVDGALVDTMNAYDGSGNIIWQQQYNSPEFAFGNHTVQIKNPSTSYIDVDAISFYIDNIPTDYPVNAPSSMETSASVVPGYLRGQLHLFALVGQSNMMGYGVIPSNPPHSDTVFNFGNDYKWHVAVDPIDSSTGQIDSVSNDGSSPAYSLGIPFAIEMQSLKGGEAVGLIPCAKGDTQIWQWQKDYDADTLYGSCWRRILAASTMGHLDGILYAQGESDAYSYSTANSWAMEFNYYVNDIRADTGQSNLPVVFTQIGTMTTPATFPYWLLVQSRQAQISIPNVVMITTTDIPLGDNWVHWSTAGLQTVGVRMADAMSPMLP